jgi:biopolymer transport protein ExbB
MYHLASFATEFAAAVDAVRRFIGDGGFFMLCLVALSLLSVAVIVYKALGLKVENVVPQAAQDALSDARSYLESGERTKLVDQLRASPSALSRVATGVLSGEHGDRGSATTSAEAEAREEVVELEKGIALLEVVITIAPLLGLLGTVSGLVGVFTNLDPTGVSGARAEVAKGIAEALYTTIAGLAVAVPTVIAHSYFTRKLERMGVRMEVLVGGLIGALHGKVR